MFTLNSDITIGSFRFGGVHEVIIRRSMHAHTDTAEINLPALAVRSGQPQKVVTGAQFNDGDPVQIQLGYNGTLREEFAGFVTRRSLGRPLVVHCEGFGSLLSRVQVRLSERAITVADLLERAVTGLKGQYNFSLNCGVDITLNNVQLTGNGLDVLQAITRYTDGNVGCFFLKPNLLWCGLLYSGWARGADTFSAGAVSYRAGYNVVDTTSLRPKMAAPVPVRVQYTKRLRGGGYIGGLSNLPGGGISGYQRHLNQLEQNSTLQQLANEKAIRLGYSGYEGTLSTFLEPFVAPGYRARLVHNDYPERDGEYLVEGVETRFGQNGARRKVALGPKFGYLNT
ncbi:MAG: hypothetical protein EBZ77_11815 [Chitinophagia bacterium]|nr:hypothetical protein [Chitinophagia bacterium]